jgi:DNA-binding response OmpR family regulator
MEPLDQEIAKALTEQTPARGPARILVVGGDRTCAESLVPALRTRRHECTVVDRLGEARAAVTGHRYDVILLQCRLPDGAGLDLLPIVQKTSPATKAILLGNATDGDAVVTAMRSGIVDILDTDTCEVEDFLARVDAVIIRARVDQQREDRITRLKKICKELNVARREVTDQVDTLCHDLAAAYQDLSDQMDDVTMATEFRTLISQELDVEDLLRTTLEYALTKTGPTNAAVFLPDQAGQFGLGAYVNYDCPRDSVSILLDHLCEAVCPQMLEEQEIVAFNDAAQFAEWIGLKSDFLGDCEVISFACRHETDCLAVIVLFRSKSDPFEEKLGGTIDVLRAAFAHQLANLIKIHHRATDEWPDEPEGGELEDDYGFGIAA